MHDPLKLAKANAALYAMPGLQEAAKMASIYAEASAKLMRELDRAQLSLTKAMKRAEGLGTFGWTIPMNFTPEGIVWLLDEATTRRAADKAFEDLYFSDGNRGLNHLKDLLVSDDSLKRYRPLLEEISKTLDAKHYRICVPALFSLIEGIAHHNWTPNFYKEKGRRQFFESKLKGMASGSLGYYVWSSIKAFVNTVFKTATNTRPLIVNRHWIMHGRDIPDGTPTDCLRLLIAISTFATFIA
jgi:hypothetical protein